MRALDCSDHSAQAFLSHGTEWRSFSSHAIWHTPLGAAELYGQSNESFTVEDARQQVLDYFKLLNKAASVHGAKSSNIVWQLLSASTNSPFTIEATAVSRIPGKSVETESIASASMLAEGLSCILCEQPVPDWMDNETQQILHNLLQRSQNGISQTDCYLPDSDSPLLIDSSSARRTIEVLEPKLTMDPSREIDFTHSELGLVEGRIIGLGTYHKDRTIVLRTLLDKREIKCELKDPEIRDAICARCNGKQVYEDRRV